MSWKKWLQRGAIGTWVLIWAKMGFVPEMVYGSAPIIFVYFTWLDVIRPLRQAINDPNPTTREEPKNNDAE